MAKLVLVRHGQSVWNAANRFTGWVDVPLSAQGREEAAKAGAQLSDLPADVVFVSGLMRAQQTAMIALSYHHSGKVPIRVSSDVGNWGDIHDSAALEEAIICRVDSRLNERCYGELQGRNKDGARQEFGADQVHIWRRSYDVPPPGGESLQMTAERTLPCLRECISPELAGGRNCFVFAHGNSLRSIIMDIMGLSKEEVIDLELPTGVPQVFDYVKGKWARSNTKQCFSK